MASIENFDMEITTLKRMRTVWVYLPDNYSPKGEGFPVIYMHDGQNLFYDNLTAFGTAWHVDKVLQDIYRSTGMSCIVVGVECNDKVRLSEYSPWGINPLAFKQKRTAAKDKQNRGGEGAKYAEWFANVLKPHIDSRYNTDRQRMATAVAGSSMGGLISCYLGLKYQRIYETMGLFSTYTEFNQPAFNRFESRTVQNLPQHAFIYVGGKEWGNQDPVGNRRMVASSVALYDRLVKREVCCELAVDSELIHFETAWEAYFRPFAEHFLQRYRDYRKKQ